MNCGVEERAGKGTWWVVEVIWIGVGGEKTDVKMELGLRLVFLEGGRWKEVLERKIERGRSQRRSREEDCKEGRERKIARLI
jgi:hypothetical protein